MAIVKFGALVTVGVGKLGGHVFSRNANGVSIRTGYSSRGDSYFNNPTLAPMFATARARWRNSSQAQKDQWAVIGQKYPVPDWDGDNNYLTGSQFHTRVTVHALKAGVLAEIDPFSYDNFVPLVECNRVIAEMSVSTIKLRYNSGFTNIDLDVYAYPLSITDYKKTTPSLVYVGSIGAGLYGSSVVYDNMVTLWGAITTGRPYTFKVGITTSSGVSSYTNLLALEYD